ncbi:MAG: cysteine hydrolase [Gammaproteobacteria bacterium]|nr:cysteine hydrolase [Gammaproteobacteria bacterium]NNM01909.1 cysteine hydrolase [Gammaproteobacteria bacterium]
MEPTYVEDFTREFRLTAATTALVVVDMQYASGSREHGLGALLARQGRLADAAYRFDRIDQLIIPNTRKLLAAFRGAGAPVVYVTLGPTQPDYSDAPIHMRKWFEATNNHAGNREHEIVDALRPEAGELVVNKTTIGAFGSTAIDSALKAKGISEIVVTGVSTNNCVGMTAMEAADRQYGVVLVADATGTCSDEMQDATLASFRRLWGRVMSTDEVIEELGAEQTAARRAAG